VTGLGWLGPVQPMWAELGPAPKFFLKKIKNKKNRRNRKIKKYVYAWIKII
jgi:hypothetical protein